MYRPQRRTIVPTEIAFQDNHPRAKAVLPTRAPKTVDVPASYAMDSPAVHYHYHESPVRVIDEPLPQYQAPVRMEYYNHDRNLHMQTMMLIAIVAMGLIIIGLIIALCCVSSSKRSLFDTMLLQQRYRYGNP